MSFPLNTADLLQIETPWSGARETDSLIRTGAMDTESVPHQRPITANVRRNADAGDRTESHPVLQRGRDPLSFVDTKSFWQLVSVASIFMLLLFLWGSPQRRDWSEPSSGATSSSLRGEAEVDSSQTSSSTEPSESDSLISDLAASEASAAVSSSRPFLSSASATSAEAEDSASTSVTPSSSLEELPIIDPSEAFVEKQEEEARKIVVAAKCGTWQAEYIQLHRDILSGRSAPRYAVSVPPQSGLCDRLVGVMATFLYALVTRRAFQITNLNMGPFEYGWDAPNINWTRPPDPLEVVRPVDEKQHNEDTCVTCPPVIAPELLENKKYGYGYFINDFDLAQEVFRDTDLEGWPDGGEAETVFIASNRGVIPKIFSNDFHTGQLKEWGLESESAFGCIFDFLFRPNDDVVRLMHEPLRRLREDRKAITIGLQVRVGDKVFGQDTGAMQDAVDYVKCALQIEQTRQASESDPVKWFFMSDSVALKSAIKKEYGDKVVMLETGLIQHIRRCTAGETLACYSTKAQRRVLETAAADLTLFAHTRFQVITHGSSFGRVGAFMSTVVHGESMAVYEIPLVSDCRPESVVDPMELAARYAGA
eukprot:TRINITY_DN6801_c0_g1_i1.p1 TRINITY_DN6801_c0_g1~~TRINITY_DN6801_c0_g1_i1.p1  ORF type:complete len:594 (+),score=81.31 TRINITY_DN6801_c0_g1_i1:442-2223(+)